MESWCCTSAWRSAHGCSVLCCGHALFQPPWKRAGSQSHGCVGLVQGGWEVLWPGWCPQLPSITSCALKHRLPRVRAALQGAALRSKAGNWGGPWGYGCWGEHGGRRRIWKDSHADPMVRGQELGIMYAGCKWYHCSLRPRTGEKCLVEMAAASAGEQGG